MAAMGQLHDLGAAARARLVAALGAGLAGNSRVALADLR